MEAFMRHNIPSATTPLVPSSPRFMSPQMTPRRSGRASRAHTSDLTSNKENLSPLHAPSTSAKTLDMISPMVNSSPSPSKRKSPFSGASKRIQASKLVGVDQDDAMSSSDESNDSSVVFFGQPSSAEKKRRVRYEQRVIEKRLRHKDSLDLTRQRPISFNPDDTMLMEDTSALHYGWCLDGPTPAPAKPVRVIIQPRQQSPLKESSHISSPLEGSPFKAASEDAADAVPFSVKVQEGDNDLSSQTLGVTRPAVQASGLQSTTNPFLDWSSPRKASSASPHKFSSPVRSVETLIDATLSQQQAPRSARRSPRLSLRRLQQSISPLKPVGVRVQNSSAICTPFAKAKVMASVPPPSTGLSAFACLRIASAAAAPNGSVTQDVEELASPTLAVSARAGQHATDSNSYSREAQSSPHAHQVRLASPSRADRSMRQAAKSTPKPAAAVGLTTATPNQVASEDCDDISIRISHQPQSASVTASTPARISGVEDAKLSPGPVFRQTARRVPIQQHEAEFGVKLSPDKRGSPYKGHGKSSALRTQEPMAKPDKIPARRVQMYMAHPASDPVMPSKTLDAAARRAPSVASKASRAAGPFVSRLGSRGASTTLPPAVLSRAVSGPASALNAGAKPPVRTQSVASKPTVMERAPLSQSSPKRPISGLPRSALSSGSRLPRPAVIQTAQNGARSISQSRPVPMAVARLPPSVQASAAKPAQQASDPKTSVPDTNLVSLTHADRAAPLLRQQVATASPRKISPELASAPLPRPDKATSPVRPVPARIASPAHQAPVKSVSPARSAQVIVRDPEQQRLRCLAMQERARNRPQRNVLTNPTSCSSETESPTETRSSPIRAVDSPDVGSEPSSEASSSPVKVALSTASSAPRSLRASRSVRTLTPSTQRVPAARGRALSLNDIIAARKVDVPLTLTDQLRLADTVNKKQNEKILAKYKITKVHHPYERPPSPDQHVHEPEACVIVDDQGNHRKGKGDMHAYSTPHRARPGSTKNVKWYRPLFVDRGSHYGNKQSTVRSVLKPISYNLDKLGNKMATGSSPKLTVGQPVIIFRNYFKGEAVPEDA